ncbi:DUF6918 family protein [Antrihabitans cavernicola]|uniref:Uncharacterized protein n=1 Tax=Antrihabitans cavernicola TaxID=2495913 RepID=A0A5A7S7T2_9NOCA|nr:hypothetical protein [Spelaeibacter cavernicola]KAA0020228.1 hypothetical protein FOY51_21555 [Spelaeibacter cavernicola]
MVVALNETLLEESRRPTVVADVKTLIDAEVSDKKGASGLAVKGGYAAVKKVSPSIVTDAVETLLPQFSERLEPFWASFQGSGEGSFANYLVGRGEEVSDALLSVTDARIDASSRPSLKKVYATMRPSAKKNVVEALPRLGELVQKHAS